MLAEQSTVSFKNSKTTRTHYTTTLNTTSPPPLLTNPTYLHLIQTRQKALRSNRFYSTCIFTWVALLIKGPSTDCLHPLFRNCLYNLRLCTWPGCLTGPICPPCPDWFLSEGEGCCTEPRGIPEASPVFRLQGTGVPFPQRFPLLLISPADSCCSAEPLE